MRKALNIKEITSKRSIWMAFAILWVIFFHSGLTFRSTPLSLLKTFGYGGVDIFFLASGIGCYFSYRKDQNFIGYMKRRALRILPAYFLFLPIWCIVRYINKGITIPQIIGNIFCVQEFSGTGNSFNWYIDAIWAFYLLVPILSEIANSISKKRFYGVLIVLIILSFSFWNSVAFLMMATRLPIFFLGIYFARIVSLKDSDFCINSYSVGIILVIFFLGVALLLFSYHYCPEYLWNYGLWWYPFLFITPGLCLLISFSFNKIEQYKLGKKLSFGFQFIGKYTFELYLSHILVFEIYQMLIDRNYLISRNLYWLFAILISFIIGFLLKKTSKSLTEFFLYKSSVD